MTAFTAPSSSYNFDKKYFDKVALIDADRIKHLVAYNIFNFLKQNYTRQDFNIDEIIDERLASIFNSYNCKGFVFLFSGVSSKTFRNHVAYIKKYKGNRVDSSFYNGKIEDMSYVVSYIQKTYPTLIYPDLEADDLLGMLQSESTFIHSNDKDSKQIPGYHYDENKRDLIYVTEKEAMKTLAIQLLTGDTTDNIAGLPGYGSVKAEKVLKDVDVKVAFQIVLREYQRAYKSITVGTDAFVETWNLVKLRLNRGDYFVDKYKEAFDLVNILKQK